MSEDPRQGLFDAAAVGITFYQDADGVQDAWAFGLDLGTKLPHI